MRWWTWSLLATFGHLAIVFIFHSNELADLATFGH